MRYSKMLTWLTVAAGMALSGASTLSAQDSYWERREDSRHIRRDYDRLDRMRAHIAQDRARLNEDIRCGRDRAAARDAADLARDQRALAAQARDIRQDYRERY
jgi:hypothetical protein